MKLPSLAFRSSKKGKKTISHFSREEYILGGVSIAFFLLIIVLGYDGYLFYEEVLQGPEKSASPLPQKKISEDDLDEIISLLDARQKKFEEILSQ